MASLLGATFSTVSGSDCALPGLGKRRREAREDNSNHPNDQEPESKSNKPPCLRDVERSTEVISGHREDVMEAHDAPLQGMEGPEALRMDREAFTELDRDTKIKLTKDLTAEEWDRLLGRFWATDGDYERNVSIMYYTLEYDVERRVEMLEEALTENLEYLFAGMCDLAYVPRTSKVMRLLERGLKVYPDRRHLILSTIYQLGYPVAQWHLDNTKEDLALLQNLINMRWIKREAIAGHLAEIVTLCPIEVLNCLLAEEILTMDDVCTMRLYRVVCGLGGKGYLEWAKDKCELRPDQGCIDVAVSGGHENVVEFMEVKLGMKMRPSQNAVNEAAANGMLALLLNKCSIWGLFPNADGANGAAGKGHLDVLKWLMEQAVSPNRYGADKAAANGHIKVLEWLASLEPDGRRVYPGQDGANVAAMNGHLDVLRWLAGLEPEERRVYPSQCSANVAAMNGHLEVLRWLAGLEPEERRVYPHQLGADWAAGNGHLEVLKWLATLEPKRRRVYLDRFGADEAAGNGHINVLKWLEESRVYPSRRGANAAAENGQLDALRWLMERGVYPDQSGANLAAENGRTEVLEWLRGQGLIAH